MDLVDLLIGGVIGAAVALVVLWLAVVKLFHW